MTRSVGEGRRATEQRVYAAAAQLFATKGFDATTMSDIAGEANIGKPTLYRYFGSRDDLFLAVLDREGSKLIAALGEGADRDSSPAEVIRGKARSFLQFVEENPAPWMVYVQAARVPQFAAEINKIRASFAETLEPALYAQLRASGQTTAFLAGGSLLATWEAVAMQVATGGSDAVAAAAFVADATLFFVEAASQANAERGSRAQRAHRRTSSRQETTDRGAENETLHDLIERARAGISDAWAEAITKYGVVSAGRLSKVNDVDPSVAEDDLLRQVRDGALISLPVEGRGVGREVVLFPAFQFGPDGTVLPVMSAIGARLADTWDVETRLLWLTSPNGWLGAQSPADLLATQPDAVLRALDLATNAA
jgi:AcrR family transcriptional regulator